MVPQCAPKKAKYCQGVKGDRCKKETETCEWEYKEGDWEHSCKGKPSKVRCPWLEGTTLVDDQLECMDGFTCDGQDDPACCDLHGGRAKCPPNHAHMCEVPCGEGAHCCRWDTCAAHGGNRQC